MSRVYNYLYDVVILVLYLGLYFHTEKIQSTVHSNAASLRGVASSVREHSEQHFVSESIVSGCAPLFVSRKNFYVTKRGLMSNVFIILVTFSNIVFSLDTDTVLQDKENSARTICKLSVSKTVNLKPFKCHNDFLWRRLDSLKQWKRRKRMAENFGREIKNGETDIIKFESYQNSVDSLVTTTIPRSSLSIIGRFKERWPVAAWREYGLFSDEYLHRINDHWLRFPPPDPWLQYMLGATYIVMTSVGCFGNILVLLMYLRCRTLRTPGNILVANLALSDFVMLAKTPIFIFNSFNLGPALGETGCVIYGFLGGLTGTTSIATLSAIALDRYWAVVRPLEPLRALTAIRARLLALGAWLYAALFAMIPALNIGYGRYVPEGFLTSCSFDYLTEGFKPRVFIFVFFCAAWLIPFCTISFCYIRIFRVVVGNRTITTKNQELRLSSRHVKERTKRKAEIKLAFLVMAVIALFFVSWTPYAVVTLLGIFGRKDLITPISSMIPALFCKTAACINPFIYIITHPKFRKEFKKLLFRDKSKRMSGTMRTIGYCTEASKMHRPSRDLSDTDVEIIEMKDIPFQTEERYGGKIKTISSRLSEREDSLQSISMKSLEENVISPPSWFSKPQFSKKRSFHRRSTRSIISQNTDPTA